MSRRDGVKCEKCSKMKKIAVISTLIGILSAGIAFLCVLGQDDSKIAAWRGNNKVHAPIKKKKKASSVTIEEISNSTYNPNENTNGIVEEASDDVVKPRKKIKRQDGETRAIDEMLLMVIKIESMLEGGAYLGNREGDLMMCLANLKEIHYYIETHSSQKSRLAKKREEEYYKKIIEYINTLE